MFYDRKNILPEYRIQTSFHHKNLSMFVPYNDNPELNKKQSFPLKVSIPLTIENQGMRPASIIKFSLDLFLFEDASDHEIIRLESIDDYLSEPIILQSGHMLNKRIEFMSRQFINYDYSFVTNKIEEFRVNTRNILTKSILLTLSTGSIISSDLTISTK
jgi:hypothetical protein